MSKKKEENKFPSVLYVSSDDGYMNAGKSLEGFCHDDKIAVYDLREVKTVKFSEELV